SESPEVVMIFRGTHQVLSAEKALKGGGVPVRLIPVPRRLTSDCGLAVRLQEQFLPLARETLAAVPLAPASVHRQLANGEYEEVTF
ncbi:MAG TPA: DUF3343 domain-containing protein, partial [Candidatus Deferrimicrobiaceae bacterium]